MHKAKRRTQRRYTQLSDIENQCATTPDISEDSCTAIATSRFLVQPLGLAPSPRLQEPGRPIQPSRCGAGDMDRVRTLGAAGCPVEELASIRLKRTGISAARNVELLKQADIVVTNVFAFPRIRPNWCSTARSSWSSGVRTPTYKEIFPLIKDNRMWRHPEGPLDVPERGNWWRPQKRGG